MIKTADSRLLMLVEADCMPGEPGLGGQDGDSGAGGIPGSGGKGGQQGWGNFFGYPGPDGRNGNCGRKGGSVEDSKVGQTAQNGGMLWVVLDRTGEIIQKSSTRYDAMVESFNVAPTLNGGIFEPNERVTVSNVLAHNTGGLDLPCGASAFMPSTKLPSLSSLALTFLMMS